MPDLEPALAHRAHLVQFLTDLLGDLDQTQFRQAIRRPCDGDGGAWSDRDRDARDSRVLTVQVERETSALRSVDLLGVVFPPGRIVATDGMSKVGVGRQQRMAERLPEQRGSLSGFDGQVQRLVRLHGIHAQAVEPAALDATTATMVQNELVATALITRLISSTVKSVMSAAIKCPIANTTRESISVIRFGIRKVNNATAGAPKIIPMANSVIARPT